MRQFFGEKRPILSAYVQPKRVESQRVVAGTAPVFAALGSISRLCLCLKDATLCVAGGRRPMKGRRSLPWLEDPFQLHALPAGSVEREGGLIRACRRSLFQAW